MINNTIFGYKKNSIRINIFGYKNKQKMPSLYIKKYCKEKLSDLLLIEEQGK